MDIHHLPQDIFPDKKQLDPVIIHKYSAPVGSFKGRSILQSNAISLVIQGEKKMHFAEKTVHIKDDSFHFLSAGNCLASMDIPAQPLFTSILLFFDSNVLLDFYLKYDSRIQDIKARLVIQPEPYISVLKDAFICHYIDSLDLLIRSGVVISAEMKALKFEELMLYLLEKFPQELLSFQFLKKTDMEDLQIRKAVETNIVNAISLEELAFLCNTSLSTFKRRFEKIYGTSPVKWLLRRRMEMARDLLQHYGEKPSDVYYKVGYENHSSFTQSFKQTYGMTPSEFQQRG